MLEFINNPEELKKLNNDELIILADDIREFLIENIEKTGGHLASNLGTIELSIALHKVFDCPNDAIIWDVGHQAYTHKILTGRKDKMHTIRQKNGLSGFTKISESSFDVFGAGHSSTSISAALGVAIANGLNNKKDVSIAVIGDGALTGGMAFEALNHAGDSDANLLIVLNDNDMSISKNVGALNKYLTKLLSGKVYSTMKEKSMKILERVPSIKKFAQKSEEHLKGMILPGTLFEELGIDYFGPINGHDIPTLIKTLNNLKEHKKPRILHVVTKKGNGLEKAEQDPCKFHGISANTAVKQSIITFSGVFGQWLLNQAKNDEKVVAITPAMCEGSGMQEFAKQYPKRYFDVGIAEQHAITFAGGLATQGFKVIVAIYSTFLQRAYDQLIHDIVLQKLPIVFAIDRAGLVGEDGATHAGVFDLSFLRVIPDLVIIAPSDANECYLALNTALAMNKTVAVRYPRGYCVTNLTIDENICFENMQANIIFEGEKIAILSFGNRLKEAKKAGKVLNATVVDMRFVKPLDEELIKSLEKNHLKIITIEDNTIKGGAGSAVLEFVMKNNLNMQVKILGIPDEITHQGSQDELYQDYGLMSEDIITAAK
ncbi:1-deoxy-D-xylulose 5-phosphate synthase [hydrothermal vent metagenome]|uniref:1-deoxy-D-xylulose-5-phosphate synthase n=1 Tax=hydrothermal vent metagenome TaxID=652676 RepID=A0A1W1BWZ0_9ZZZZ